MELSKKDWPKLYGPNGIYSKFTYIKKVIDSCKTAHQVGITEKWGITVLTKDNELDDENLNPPFSLLPNEISYMLKFDKYYWECCKEIRRYANKKVRELSDGKEEGKTA